MPRPDVKFYVRAEKVGTQPTTATAGHGSARPAAACLPPPSHRPATGAVHLDVRGRQPAHVPRRPGRWCVWPAHLAASGAAFPPFPCSRYHPPIFPVALVFGFILMPLWPDWMKQGVSYTGWVALGLLVILLLIELRTSRGETFCGSTRQRSVHLVLFAAPFRQQCTMCCTTLYTTRQERPCPSCSFRGEMDTHEPPLPLFIFSVSPSLAPTAPPAAPPAAPLTAALHNLASINDESCGVLESFQPFYSIEKIEEGDEDDNNSSTKKSKSKKSKSSTSSAGDDEGDNAAGAPEAAAEADGNGDGGDGDGDGVG